MSKKPKTPKSGGKEKLKIDASSKIKYGIFVINIENLEPIAKQFKQDLIEHQRKAVVGFSREDVVREILVDQAEKAKKGKQSKESPNKGKKGKNEGKEESKAKDKRGKKGKEQEKGVQIPVIEKPEKDVKIEVEEEKLEPINLDLFVLDEKTFSTFYAKTKEFIDRSTKRSEGISNFENSKKTIDLLTYWQKDSGGTLQKVDEKKGKAKAPDDKKDKKRGERKMGGEGKKETGKKEKEKVDKKGNKKTDKFNEDDDDGCQLKEINVVRLKEKPWSKVQPNLGNYHIKSKYIKDHPSNSLDAYVVLLGNFGNDLYFEMIKKNLPLHAISTFLPQALEPKPKEKITNPTINELNNLKKSSSTKGIGIFLNFVSPISECTVQKFRKQIYDQLSWHLYDLENTRRQFENYIKHFKEFDVSETRPCLGPIDILKDSGLPENALDDNLIPIYLDTILEMVQDSLLGTMDMYEMESEEYEEHKQDEGIDTIFLSSNCKSSIIEDTNTLLKTTLKSEIDLEYYYRSAEMLKLVAPFEKIWCLHGGNFSEGGNKTSTNLFADSDFCEPYSCNALSQKFKEASDNYDGCDFLYFADHDAIIVTFNKSKYSSNETHINSVLPTKVNFRDYCEYIANRIQAWTFEQELLYDIRQRSEVTERALPSPEPLIPESDFFRVYSIKWNSLKNQQSLPVVPTNFDNNGKKEKKNEKTANKKDNKTKGTKHEVTKTTNFKEEPKTEKVVFLGYNVGDMQLELDSYRLVYRSVGLILNLFRDEWVDGHKSFRLKFNYKRNNIFYNRNFPTNHNPARLRIEAENFITFAITHSPLPPIEIGEEEGIQEGNEDQMEASYPHVTITWPSLLRIESHFDRETKSVTEVRQYSWRKSLNERSRFIYSDGTIVVLYTNGAARVYTANGTQYESKSSRDHIVGDNLNMVDELSEFAFYQNKYQNEIEYIARYHKLLDSESFLLTTAEGYNFYVKYGQIVSKNHKFLNMEWYDYATGERFSSREDGMKTVTTAECLSCYYPDNTLIKSYATSRMLYKYFMDESGQESFVVFTEGDHTVSAVEVTKSIIIELFNISSDELFVYVDINRKFQHECYATVSFDKENGVLQDKVSICSPDGVNLSITEKKAFINLAEQLYLDVSKDCCRIQTANVIAKEGTNINHSILTNSTIHAFINFGLDDQLPLFQMINEKAELIVAQDCVWKINDFNKGPTLAYEEETKPINEEEEGKPMNIALERNFNAIGYTLYSEEYILKFEEASFDPETIKVHLDDGITIITPLKTFNEIFRLPIQHLAEFLKKFEGNNFICAEENTKEDDSFCDSLPKMMTIRSFLKLEKFKRPAYPSNVNFSSRTSVGSSVGYIHAGTLLEVALQKSLAEYQKTKLLSGRHLSKTNFLFEEVMDSKIQKNKRLKIYLAMLNKKFYPKYWDFADAGGHIRYLNVCKYATALEVSDVCSTDCFTSLLCECPSPEGPLSFEECVEDEEEEKNGTVSNLAIIQPEACECEDSEHVSTVCECSLFEEEFKSSVKGTPRTCECSSASDTLKICECPTPVNSNP